MGLYPNMTLWAYWLVVMEYGRSSFLFDVVLIVADVTEKVVDYHVMSKHCAGCQYWEAQDKSTEKFRKWKEEHDCANFRSSNLNA